VKKHLVDLPRLAVFTTWGSTRDVGWVRYAFDHFEIYDLIISERIRQKPARGVRRDRDSSQGRAGSKGLVFDHRIQASVCVAKGGVFPAWAYGEQGTSPAAWEFPAWRSRQVRQ
jgi:hypothetical protein